MTWLPHFHSNLGKLFVFSSSFIFIFFRVPRPVTHRRNVFGLFYKIN